MRPSTRTLLGVGQVSLAFLIFCIAATPAWPQGATAKKDAAPAAPAIPPAGGTSKAQITSFEPSTLSPGHSTILKVRGTSLDALKGTTINLTSGSTTLPVPLHPCTDETDISKVLCGILNIPPATPMGQYSISVAEADKGFFATGGLPPALTFQVTSADLEKDYVLCPTARGTLQTSIPNPNPAGASGGHAGSNHLFPIAARP